MQSAMTPLNVPVGAGGGAGRVVVNMPVHPPDYAVWSVASFIYGNPFCLGLVALIFSMKARDMKIMGDMNGARMYGVKARTLNILALVFIIIMIGIGIAVTVITKVQEANQPASSNKKCC